MHGNTQTVDIILPVYNEENVIATFYSQLTCILDQLPYDFRLIYVDDGSTDGSVAQLMELARKDERLTVVELSRNFGHQAALSAGLSIANADFIVFMDSDGQHPPELIPRMIDLAQSGFDIILTHRSEQESLGFLKRGTSSLFYKIINFLSSTHLEPGAGDFRLINANAAMALRSMPEYHRFLRGMVAWMGFRSTVVLYTPKERIAGRSKYSPGKMVRLAQDAIFSFSLMPLYIAILIGLLFLVLAFAEISYVLSFWVLGRANELAPGWASLMFIMLLIGGTTMVTLGIIGVYVGYIFQEVKHRPVFIIRSVYHQG
jgi:polyisoprenyl-phosphate glycosyltransferase